MPDEAVELTVEALDFWGNRAVLIVPIKREAPAWPINETTEISHNEAPTGTVAMACQGAYLTVTAHFHAAETQAPELLVESGLDILNLPFLRVGDRVWQAAFAPTRSAAYVLRVSHPRIAPNEKTVHAALRGMEEQTLSFDELQLRIKPVSPFGVLFVHAENETSPQNLAIPLRGRAWRIWPEESPIDAQVALSLPLPPDVDKPACAGLYRDSGSGWRYVGQRQRGGLLTAEVRNFGVYAVLEDNSPPVIAVVSPPEGYQAQTQRPILKATIADVGSGIADFSITANGRWLLALYDPDEDRLEWEQDHPLDAGDNEIVFQVTDNAGNVTTTRRVIHIP